jgi:hypothetical protein
MTGYAKTDKLNAKMIAHYGEAIKPDLSVLKASCYATDE